MTTAIPTAVEAARLHALHQYAILDTPPEQSFDDITLLAAQLCNTPMALISLVDKDRQWFKSKRGITLSETTREIAICAHGILQSDVWVIPDMLADPRFAENPLVTDEPRIRFYAVAPLRIPQGHAIGMLCVQDRVARSLSEEQIHGLRVLGRQVVAQLELRRHVIELQMAIAVRDQTEERYRNIVENAMEGIFQTTPQGRFVTANPGLAQMLGYDTPQQLIDTITDIGRELYAEPTQRRQVVDLLANGSVRGFEAAFYRRDGSKIWVLLDVRSARDPESGETFYEGIATDITERRRAEERLKHVLADLQRSHEDLKDAQLHLIQAEKLDSIGRLAAGIAHEVKNPLAIILKGVEYLSSAVRTTDENVPSVLRDMHDAVNRADMVIRDLLDFSATRQLDLVPQDLNQVVKVSLSFVKHELVKHPIKIVTELENNLPHLALDRIKIEEVFVNLFMNSIYAMPKGGTLTVRTFVENGTSGNVPEGTTTTTRRTTVIAEVDDTGTGIPEDKLCKVFDPFFTTKPTGSGTGLGLTVTKTIVDLHGGSITLQNRREGGVKVRITLTAGSSNPNETDTYPGRGR